MKTLILHNIISPYKTAYFNVLYQQEPDLFVLYIAPSEKIRDWSVDLQALRFPYEILFNDLLEDITAWSAFKRTWQALNKYQPEQVLLCQYVSMAFWAALVWAKLHRKKCGLWSASNKIDRARKWYREIWKKLFVQNCNFAFTYSSQGKAYLVELGMPASCITVTGNPQDNAFYEQQAAHYRPQRTQLQQELKVKKNNFIFVGRLSVEKNITVLLKAFEAVQAKTGWGLILVGAGSQEHELRRYIEHNKVPDVFLPGFKQKDDLVKYYVVSDVLILPSLSEPWGLVANEAMATGLPVLVSHHCGCYPDLVRDQVNGFSFAPDNQPELERLMLLLASSYELRRSQGEQAAQDVREFTPEKIAEKMKKIL